MKKYKVYCKDVGYEQIIEAENDTDAITQGYEQISTNLYEYIEVDFKEIKNDWSMDNDWGSFNNLLFNNKLRGKYESMEH